MVMIIAFKCTEREAQIVCGMDPGSSTCVFRFPAEDVEAMADSYRIYIYGCDYSLELHGNPKLHLSEGLPADSWAFRITPYGTRHGATWAKIIEKVYLENGAPAAAELLSGIAELPLAKKLGGSGRNYFPATPAPGLDLAPRLTLPEGSYGKLVDYVTGLPVGPDAVGLVLNGYVGKVKFERRVHIAQEMELAPRRAK